MTLKVSVVCATFNRAKLLDKALRTYAGQTMTNDQWEYIIVDDGSEDNTREIVHKYIEKGLPLRLLDADADCGLPKEPGKWRDGCVVRNIGSTFAHGQVIIGTHPEIMIPPDALDVMCEAVQANQKAWVTAIPYWLPNASMPRGWNHDINKLRGMEGFYDPDWPDQATAPGSFDYTNNNQEVRPTWESEVFWAMDMGLWRDIGGFRHFEKWGSIDMDFMNRRKAMGMPTAFAYSMQDSERNDGALMVYHQWHESKRDMDAAMNELKQGGANYPTKEAAYRAGGLSHIYHHGHRERSISGKLDGVMGDHISRYEFAGFFSGGKDVLDIPCGTGYGAQVFKNDPHQVRSYIGVDIDEESIRFATKNYSSLLHEFMSGNMINIPLPEESVDRVYSFEGIEHLPSLIHQQAFVREIYRILRPDGTFIISTPQKGATGGTMWDVSMLTRSEFQALFSPDDWKSLDWFYQLSYGLSKITVHEGYPPATAEIMLLGGSKNV